MSSKVWFSPAIPQMNVQAPVPTPEWMDQEGEITASCETRFRLTLLYYGFPLHASAGLVSVSAQECGPVELQRIDP
jgi:hypothetical protein